MKAGSDSFTVLKSAGVNVVLVKIEGYGMVLLDPDGSGVAADTLDILIFSRSRSAVF